MWLILAGYLSVPQTACDHLCIFSSKPLRYLRSSQSPAGLGSILFLPLLSSPWHHSAVDQYQWGTSSNPSTRETQVQIPAPLCITWVNVGILLISSNLICVVETINMYFFFLIFLLPIFLNHISNAIPKVNCNHHQSLCFSSNQAFKKVTEDRSSIELNNVKKKNSHYSGFSNTILVVYR